MRRVVWLFCAVSPAAAFAADPPPPATGPVDEIVVRADPLKLLELDESRTVYGLDLSYAETPRAVSVVSDETIRRFGVDTVDDLADVAPGTFTGSFFGVPGSVNLRGNRADTFFRGFRRVENPGSFPTPLGASERIEIVRGPVPPVYGAGRVGGFLNITPTTARTRDELGPRGALAEIAFTGGSWGKKVGAADLGAAFGALAGDAGVYLHAEHERSRSWYRGIEPRRTLVQASVDWTRGPVEAEFGGMVFDADGYRQTIGWNRATQALIDAGVYRTGRDTDLRDLDGDGRLQPAEVDAAVGAFFGASNIRQFVDFGVTTGPAFALDSGLGTTRLDPRTVFLSDDDVGRARTGTANADVAYHANDKLVLRVLGFYDSMNAKLYQSTGFAANYRADLYELRAQAEARFHALGAEASAVAGLSWRSARTRTLQTFLSGYLAVDRRDLAVGPQPNEVFDNPFEPRPGGIGWDTDLASTTGDLGAFATLEAKRGRFGVVAGGRLDRFSARAVNTGRTVFDPRLANALYADSLVRGSVEASARAEAAKGVLVYATFARGQALETNDGGGVEVDRIAQGNFVAPSRLAEAGVKIGRDALAASLSVYRQRRSRQDPFGNVDEETSRGVEAEARYLLSDSVSLNGAATLQETRVAAPGPCGSGNGEFVVLPPTRVGIAPAEGYGGLFAALNASCLPELSDGYVRRTTPQWSGALYATYTAPPSPLGRWGATLGGTYTGVTGGKIDGAIRLPAHALARAALFFERGRVSATATADNLFDRRYFIPVQNVYEEVGVLPGRGREIFFTIKARF